MPTKQNRALHEAPPRKRFVAASIHPPLSHAKTQLSPEHVSCAPCCTSGRPQRLVTTTETNVARISPRRSLVKRLHKLHSLVSSLQMPARTAQPRSRQPMPRDPRTRPCRWTFRCEHRHRSLSRHKRSTPLLIEQVPFSGKAAQRSLGLVLTACLSIQSRQAKKRRCQAA